MPEVRNDIEARLYAGAQGVSGLFGLRRTAGHASRVVGWTWRKGRLGVDARRACGAEERLPLSDMREYDGASQS